MPIDLTPKSLETARKNLEGMTDLQLDLAYRAATAAGDENLVTLCLLELNRRLLDSDPIWPDTAPDEALGDHEER